ncbi:MAG TPA: HEAT repeat domain-containing protein [Kiritimatiellia bacterium]|nr:HEAT repeat domain-containing protein [Kiritimatiellia bacterium]HMO98733.1 HEAT repeat domain-containing protein [Kiritimatiellia bacterium]HMP96893.1 HEAT repeat domain-containing protein [Kiritimatiellia bacterium]
MDLINERKLASRAKQLGESADAAALTELAQLIRSDSPLVRRLAASALGKLAGVVDSAVSVDLLRPCLADAHPQVRQYAAKALGAFGPAAAGALEDLRDLYKNPAEKDYVKRSVIAAGKTIREAVKIAEKSAVHVCARCARTVDADEYARSQKAFQRTYCDRCFDDVFLKRRNWETQVELNKTIEAANGTVVQSDGERIIADELTAMGLAFRYDNRFRIIKGYAIRPDFYLPELDVYIEYWGMEDNLDYRIGMLEKQKLYQQAGKRLISLYPREKPRLAEALREKLNRLETTVNPRKEMM